MSGLEEIRKRAAAASPGPWMWRGNVDHSDPELCRIKPGWGRVEVMRHYPRDRTADDIAAKQFDDYLRDVTIRDDATGEFRSYTEDERAELVRTKWLEDEEGVPRTDNRLAFAHQEYMHAVDARELAIFEVCPDATKRTDPRVYRADIVGVRHPDAEFIAHARQDVDDLLALVDELSSESHVAAIKADALREAAQVQRQVARDARTQYGEAEATDIADWLDDQATAIDPRRMEGAHP